MSQLLVLCYHAVSETWPAALSVTPARLDAQLAALRRRGYRAATLSEAVAEPSPARTVVISFDDGYRSVLELAAPILERHGFPATLFVPTGSVDSEQPMIWPGIDQWIGGPHEDELMPLDWDGVRELRRRGWQIGSHSVSHPRLTALSDSLLDDELSSSKAMCEEQLHERCTAIAYPYGSSDTRVARAAARADYDVGVDLSRWLTPTEPLRVPRVGIYHEDDERRFAMKISLVLRTARRSRLLRALIDRAR